MTFILPQLKEIINFALWLYSVFNKEGVKVEGYYTAKKWILGAV